MADSAVRYFVPDAPAVARTVRGHLEKLKSDRLEGLLVSQDWADFNRRKGEIAGLQEAIAECVEAEKQRGD